MQSLHQSGAETETHKQYCILWSPNNTITIDIFKQN